MKGALQGAMFQEEAAGEREFLLMGRKIGCLDVLAMGIYGSPRNTAANPPYKGSLKYVFFFHIKSMGW